MHLEFIPKEAWAEMSEAVHSLIFDKTKPASMDRIDFALLAVRDDKIPATYVTCREHDAFTLYWQFGGSFPESQGTTFTWAAIQMFIEWAKERSYRRIYFLVENINSAMLRLAMKAGFLIRGIRNYKDSILLEHVLELVEE